MQGSWVFWLIANAKASEVVHRAPEALDAERLQGWVHGSVWGLIALNLAALTLFLLSLCGPQINSWISAAWNAYKSWKLEKLEKAAQFKQAATIVQNTDQAVASPAAPDVNHAVAAPMDPTQSEATALTEATLAPTEAMASPTDVAPPPEGATEVPAEPPVYAPPPDDVPAEAPVYAPPPDEPSVQAAPADPAPPAAEVAPQSGADAWEALESQVNGMDFNALTQIVDTKKFAGAAGSNDMPDLGPILPVTLPPEFEPKGANPDEGFKLLEAQLAQPNALDAKVIVLAEATLAPAAVEAPIEEVLTEVTEVQTSLPAEAVSAEKVGMAQGEVDVTVKSAMDFEKSLEALLTETNFDATEELPIFDLRALEATLEQAIQTADEPAQKDSVA